MSAADLPSSTAITEDLKRAETSTVAPSSAEPEPAVHSSSSRPSEEELLQEWQEVTRIRLPHVLLGVPPAQAKSLPSRCTVHQASLLCCDTSSADLTGLHGLACTV